MAKWTLQSFKIIIALETILDLFMCHITFSQTLLAKEAYYLCSSLKKVSHLNTYQRHKLSHPSKNWRPLKKVCCETLCDAHSLLISPKKIFSGSILFSIFSLISPVSNNFSLKYFTFMKHFKETFLSDEEQVKKYITWP